MGQGGVENPFYDLRQVSNCLDLLDVHFSDLNEGNRVNAGSFYAVSTLHSRGEITFFAIMQERGARLFFPLGHVFRYVFVNYSRPSRFAASIFPASGDVDTFGRKLNIVIQHGKPMFHCCISSF